jgi:AcrR family transcriptional regulator
MVAGQAAKKSSATRGVIVDAAYRTLVRNGTCSTSVDDVAREAGVARGLIHYYFSSKEDLLLAAVEQACNDIRTEPVEDPFEAARDQLERVRHPSRKLRNFQRLLLDSAGGALHNPPIAGVLRTFLARNREGLEEIVGGMLAANDRSSAHASALTGAVYGAVLGIALQRELDPSFAHQAALDQLERLVAESVGERQLPSGTPSSTTSGVRRTGVGHRT